MANQIYTYTGGGIVPAFDLEEALPLAFQPLPAGAGLLVTFPQGCLVAESVANPGQFGLYDSTNADLNVAKGVNIYGFTVDEFGNIGWSTTRSTGQFGQSWNNAAMFVKGYFRCEDIYQTAGPGAITAAAVTALGRLISGTRAAGILRLF